MDIMKRHKFIVREHEKMDRPIYPNGKVIVREPNGDIDICNDYYHFRGEIASNEQINEWVDKALIYFEKYPESPYWRVRLGTGGTTVIVLKWQDDDISHPYYEVIVAHNYYEAFVNETPIERPTEEELRTFEESLDI
jgi:hypothetical protein